MTLVRKIDSFFKVFIMWQKIEYGVLPEPFGDDTSPIFPSYLYEYIFPTGTILQISADPVEEEGGFEIIFTKNHRTGEARASAWEDESNCHENRELLYKVATAIRGFIRQTMPNYITFGVIQSGDYQREDIYRWFAEKIAREFNALLDEEGGFFELIFLNK